VKFHLKQNEQELNNDKTKQKNDEDDNNIQNSASCSMPTDCIASGVQRCQLSGSLSGSLAGSLSGSLSASGSRNGLTHGIARSGKESCAQRPFGEAIAAIELPKGYNRARAVRAKLCVHIIMA
jgi:hypothetical protein